MSTLTILLYLAVPYTAFGAGMMTRDDLKVRVAGADSRQGARLPFATIVLCCLVAIPSLLQFPFPRLFYALRRDGDLILHHGELWRLVTALVVQDGGTAGLIGNLLVLVLVGVVAERIGGVGACSRSSSAPASSANSWDWPGSRSARATLSPISASRPVSCSAASSVPAPFPRAC